MTYPAYFCGRGDRGDHHGIDRQDSRHANARRQVDQRGLQATSLSRITIKKWLKASQGAEPKCRRDVPTKLTPFIETPTQALQADARRAKHERRTARALHVQLTGEGYGGGYTQLTDVIRECRATQRKLISAHAFLPLAF